MDKVLVLNARHRSVHACGADYRDDVFVLHEAISDGFGTEYKFKTGNVSILSPAGPKGSIGICSSSTADPKRGQNLLLGLPQCAVPCSTLFPVF
jgi:hypothetical protein